MKYLVLNRESDFDSTAGGPTIMLKTGTDSLVFTMGSGFLPSGTCFLPWDQGFYHRQNFYDRFRKKLSVRAGTFRSRWSHYCL